MRCRLAAELCIVKKGLKNVVILKIIEIRHLHYSTLTLNDKAIFFVVFHSLVLHFPLYKFPKPNIEI